MSEYLSRPVFPLVIDWDPRPAMEIDYPSEVHRIGFGWPRFSETHDFPTRSWSFSRFTDVDDTPILDAFFDSVRGDQIGFWFQNPEALAEISAIVSTTEIDTVDQDLSADWQDDPSAHVAIIAEDFEHLAEIQSVADNGTTERITFSPAAPSAIPDDATIHRLHYVRLDGDESAQVANVGSMVWTLRFTELPNHYATIETSRRPIYLYEFSLPGPAIFWRFTSYWQDVTSDGDVFIAKAITHGQLTRSSESKKESLSIDAYYESTHPLALFLPLTLPFPMYCDVYSVTVADLDTRTTIFCGQLSEPDVNGQKLTAKILSLLDAADRKLPSMPISARCSYQTFDQRTCKLDRANFEEAGNIEVISGRTIRVHNLSDFATDYFSWGTFEAGAGIEFEVRFILKATRVDADTQDLLLDIPLVHAVVTDAVTLLPGDDHRVETCDAKFSNLVNFGGHPYVPRRNLTLQAMETPAQSGGKK